MEAVTANKLSKIWINFASKSDDFLLDRTHKFPLLIRQLQSTTAKHH